MSEVDLPPTPPPVTSVPYDFKADKIVGILVMILGVLQLLVALVVFWMGQTVVSMMMEMQAVDKTGPKVEFSPPFGSLGGMYSLAGVFVVLVGIFTIFSGTQLMKGTQRGLILALVVAVMNLYGSPLVSSRLFRAHLEARHSIS